MHSKTCNSTDRIRNTARAKQVDQSVDALRLVDMEVPELKGLASLAGGETSNSTHHSPIRPVSGGMPFVTSI
jgi:hypothetical protein